MDRQAEGGEKPRLIIVEVQFTIVEMGDGLREREAETRSLVRAA
jgi:hypothetical protein